MRGVRHRWSAHAALCEKGTCQLCTLLTLHLLVVERMRVPCAGMQKVQDSIPWSSTYFLPAALLGKLAGPGLPAWLG